MALPSCERCLLYGITCRYLIPGEYFGMLQETTEEIEVEIEKMEEELVNLKNASMTKATRLVHTDSILRTMVVPIKPARNSAKRNTKRKRLTDTASCSNRKRDNISASAKAASWSISISPRKFTIQTNLHNLSDLHNLFFKSLSEMPISFSYDLQEATSSAPEDTAKAITLPRNQLFFRKFGKDAISPIINLYMSLPSFAISMAPSPMRFVIDDCIDVYFECFNNKAPVLHCRTFSSYYRTIADPLNSLIALAVATWTSEHTLIFHSRSIDSSRAIQISEFFFHRANTLLVEVFDEPNAATVYALAFLMQYRLFSPDVNRLMQPHSFYSLAVRLAQQLGLFDGRAYDNHLVFGQTREMQHELTLRLGWLLYHWDFNMSVVGYSSMLRNLPPTIPPRPLDDEDEDERAMLEFFVHNGRSRDPAWKIMTTLYEDENGGISLSLVTELEGVLQEWYDAMPLRFKVEAMDTCGPRIRPLAVSDHASYHHLSIDLHKQFIPKSAEAVGAPETQGQEEGRSAFQQRSLRICVESALRLNHLFIDLCERGETHDVFLGSFMMATEILTKVIEYNGWAGGNDGGMVQTAKWHVSKHLAVVKRSVAYDLDWRPWRMYAKTLESFLVQHEVPLEYWTMHIENVCK